MDIFLRSRNYGDTTIVKQDDVEGIGEIVELFRRFLIGAGYHHELVDSFVPSPEREWDYNDEDPSDDDEEVVISFQEDEV